MTTKHTPGPWRIEGPSPGFKGCIIHGGPYYDEIGTVTAFLENGEDERDANARLIAAAPELLAVAKSALDFIHSLPYEPSIAPSTKLQDALVDAITKATGE